jgi:hypothetical protein
MPRHGQCLRQVERWLIMSYNPLDNLTGDGLAKKS